MDVAQAPQAPEAPPGAWAVGEADGVRWTWVIFALCALSLATMAALAMMWPAPFWHDESWFLGTVPTLRAQGVSVAFLRDLPGAAGPLFTFVHALFFPLTGLGVHAVRVVNVGCFAGFVLAYMDLLEQVGASSPRLRALSLMAAPVVYPIAGTALTEAPALAFLFFGLALLLRALRRLRKAEGRTKATLLTAAAAGVMMGLAISGRQTFLVVVPAALLLLADRRWRAERCAAVGVFVVSALVFPVFLFTLWHGLVPPRTAYLEGGISVPHAVLGISYGAVLFWIVEPGWLWCRWPVAIGLFTAGAAFNQLTGFCEHLAMQSLAEHALPASLMGSYPRVVGSLLVGISLVFAANAVAMLRSRLFTTDSGWSVDLFLGASAVGLIGSAAGIGHMFAGRYVAPAVPLLLYFAYRESPQDTAYRAARMAVGCALGLVLLWTYYDSAVRWAG